MWRGGEGQLPTSPLDDPALLPEMFDHPLTVIALHFNHPVFHRTAGAARSLELFAQLLQCQRIERQTFDHGHAFSAAAFALSGDTHNPIH